MIWDFLFDSSNSYIKRKREKQARQVVMKKNMTTKQREVGIDKTKNKEHVNLNHKKENVVIKKEIKRAKAVPDINPVNSEIKAFKENKINEIKEKKIIRRPIPSTNEIKITNENKVEQEVSKKEIFVYDLIHKMINENLEDDFVADFLVSKKHYNKIIGNYNLGNNKTFNLSLIIKNLEERFVKVALNDIYIKLNKNLSIFLINLNDFQYGFILSGNNINFGLIHEILIPKIKEIINNVKL